MSSVQNESFNKALLKIRGYIVGRFLDNLNNILAIEASFKHQESNLIVSDSLLNDAIDEIVKDIYALRMRRPNDTILSGGKIAGVITFRLSRWNIFTAGSQQLFDDRLFNKLPYLVAILTGLDFVRLDYKKDVDVMCGTEIIYSLSRRHVNQETLGLVYDTIVKSKK